MTLTPDYVLRPMRLEDVPQVVTIDRQSFPTPWTASIYRYEIQQNTLSSMLTLSRYNPNGSSESGLARLGARLLGRHHPHHEVFAYGGFWFSRREAHVSTIASHPMMRGRGLGELALAAMLKRGLNMGAQILSLEVRVSNSTAIALYEKYHFYPAGLKKHYYRDNGEDAYDMRVTTIDDQYRAQFDALWQSLQARIHFEDTFTESANRFTPADPWV